MVKKIGSIFFLLLFVVNVTAFAQLEIGFMNAQEVLSQMPERSSVEQKLNDFIQQKRLQLQQRTTAFQDSVAEYQQNKASMSQAQITQEEQQLTKLETQLRQFQQNIQQQIQQRRSSLLQPLYQKMDQAIATVAENRNLDFVINEATSSGEQIIYYAASEQLNITDEVLKQINETSAQN